METKFRQARAQTSYKQLFFAGEFLNFTVDIVSQEQMLLVSKIKASQSLVDPNSTVFQALTRVKKSKFESRKRNLKF